MTPKSDKMIRAFALDLFWFHEYPKHLPTEELADWIYHEIPVSFGVTREEARKIAEVFQTLQRC